MQLTSRLERNHAANETKARIHYPRRNGQGNRGMGHCWYVVLIAYGHNHFRTLTVPGALGIPIPRLPIIGDVGSPRDMREYAFNDVDVGDWVENGFQALALDEHREPFSPSLWEKPRESRTVWHPGALQSLPCCIIKLY